MKTNSVTNEPKMKALSTSRPESTRSVPHRPAEHTKFPGGTTTGTRKCDLEVDWHLNGTQSRVPMTGNITARTTTPHSKQKNTQRAAEVLSRDGQRTASGDAR